ncbi:gliding motility-associated C-terminal domain-containing protein [Flavobacterium granuli]|uniref:Gliding motility-associated C-terminal domain-containing protein n=1 Tax=Flavobacterium granuli TaxID=280093 RepID=A0A1M5STJ9_9FLAO|nr:gliding motility-associated C-terminal domain-containing protein [Flavobacterium granuli]PRZ21117.1 gliding motility-associated-like protein [Flavobacterium granuli]SHH41832.1 gliding motility-associated C-terminal domain-containing protein [Flavobacterium granuli]
MDLKLLFKLKVSYSYFILLIVLLFSSTIISAQCAGNDNNLTVCNITDSSNKFIDLNSFLGSHTVGGIWKDNLFSQGLNISTGILDAQKIRKSGVYTYTYTVDNGLGCKDSSIITVTIGGYSGVPSPNISACSDDVSFNLFQAFNGNFLSPQSNGVWTDDDGTGALNNNLLDAKKAGLGTHSFTYTVPAIGSCPAQSSTVNVTVFRAPEPGTPSTLLLCSSDKATFSTNYDLNDLLSGEDTNGIWTEASSNELSDLSDSSVDIKNIYNTLGAGVYSFTYTVSSTNPICSEKKSNVRIIIEEQLDFTGASLVVNSDICENEISTAKYRVVLTQVNQLSQNIPNGSYLVKYEIAGLGLTLTNSVIANFNSGVLVFDVKDPTNINRIFFPEVGTYTLSIKDITSVTSLGACTNIIGDLSDILNVNPLPKINGAILNIVDVCKGSDAIVEISGNTNLTDGNYSIDYNLSGNNSATSQQLTFNVTNGMGSFSIPSALIPSIGNTTISIVKITNITTGCTNTSNLAKVFIVKTLPNVANLAVEIKDVCQGEPILVSLSGLGNLTDITINYDLSGSNTVLNQIITLAVTSGKTSFTIPSTSLNIGTTTIEITYLTDNTNGCGTTVANGKKSFTINILPSLPITNNFKFCKNDKKTIADLVPNGTQYQWFDSVSSTMVLNAGTLLVSRTYYVKEVNLTTGCESSRAAAIVEINETQAPVLNQGGESFCGLDNPTIQNLTDKTTTNGNLTWYDAAENGNLITSTDLLIDGFTYYGFDYSNDTSCYSDALAVTVSLSNCDETPDFFIPDGFSPNGDAINDTFKITGIEFIYPNYSLEIYNRYGNLMFKGNKNKPEWDGKNSDYKIGIDGFAPNGVYFYIINYNKGNKASKQGKLYLSR